MTAPTGTEYEIRTLADFGKVPIERIDAMLVDFGRALAYLHVANIAAKVTTGHEGLFAGFVFRWKDDGAMDDAVVLLKKDGSELARYDLAERTR